MKSDQTNYRLKDGDTVTLTEPARVDGYWFCSSTMSRGSWDRMHMLPGAKGVCVKARTPKVLRAKGESPYFANVDIPYLGETLRVRVLHNQLKRVGRGLT